MTAINIIVGTAKAFVMTDSTLYRPNGEIVGFGRKCFVSDDARLAVGSRGDSRLPSSIAEVCGDLYDGIDDLIGECGRSLRGLYERTIEEHGAIDAAAQMFFVGWSRRMGRPVAVSLMFDGADWSFDDRSEEGVVGPLPDATEMSRLQMLRAAPGSDYDAETFEPIAHGIPLIEAQRRMKVKISSSPTSPASFVIGGEVLLTTVAEAGIAQEVIHSWPDEPGLPIEPAPFSLPITGGASRQQRRAAARQARKAVAA